MGLLDLFRRDDKEQTEQLPEVTPPVDDVLLRALLNNETITREKALTIPAVAGAVDFLGNIIASMPIRLYRNRDGKVEEIEDDTRVSLLNGDTGDKLDAFQMKKAMVEDYLMGKGGYCYIRKYLNEVTGLFYVEDKYIEIWKSYEPIYKEFKILVMGKEYKHYEFIKLLRNTKDGASGVGLTKEVSKALETAYNTMLYQLGMVKSGGNKKGFLKAQRKLGQTEIDVLKRAWRNMYGNNNEENVVVLNNGLEFQEASSSSVEMQMNESKRTLQNEINDLFHINPNDFYETFKLAIYPILKAFETALNSSLLLEREKGKKFFEFDVKEIIKANVTERYQAYKLAKETGFMTINEMRKEENMNWIEGMDVLNVGLGAVLYDVDTHLYYTPNTDTVSDVNDGETNKEEDEEIQKMLEDHEMVEEFDESGNSAEARFNQNHDGKTGRFAPAKGGSVGDINKVVDGKITMTYVKVTGQNTQNYGSLYGQNLEPTGEYMSMDTLQGSSKIDGFEYGTIHFEKPLILEHKNTGETGWKKDLSDMYGGKTGKKLSNAIMKDGYDAVMTKEGDDFIEIVNLNGQKQRSTEERFNKNHDGRTGRFTSTKGDSGGRIEKQEKLDELNAQLDSAQGLFAKAKIKNEIEMVENDFTGTVAEWTALKKQKQNDAIAKANEQKQIEKEQKQKEAEAKKLELEQEMKTQPKEKVEQFKIIQENNPMQDDYHVGIRKPSDIKTWDEAMNDSDSFSWGDFTKQDAEKAKQSGTITVYSSYPIDQGVFVSTSKIQSEQYAGGGKVYEKTVPLKDVAWINGDEGQFAETKKRFNKNHDGKTGRFASSKGGGGYDYSDFSKSKVTDTLYHGTNKDFDQFDVSKSVEGNGAIFFGDDEEYAEAMMEEKGGGKIYEVKVNIQNPMQVTMPNNQFSNPAFEKKYIEQAKNEGFDGVIFQEENPSEFSAGKFYAVFSPEQIQIKNKRFNPNHDGKTGRFAPKSGGGGGAVGAVTSTENKPIGEQVDEWTAVVESRLSNTPEPFKKEKSVDMKEVKSRGNLTDAEAKQCVAVAEKVYDEASKKEPQITEDVVGSVSDAGGQMYGLDFRMKQPTSMAGKIGEDAKTDNSSFDEAGSKIKDAVRYTAVIDDDKFTDGYNSIKASLESKGYKEVRCKNYFQMYENNESCQKAVQCVYKDSSNYMFELQFHTPKSQGAKELNHPLYEEQRKKTTSSARADALENQMKEHGKYVPNPKGVMGIKSYTSSTTKKKGV